MGTLRSWMGRVAPYAWGLASPLICTLVSWPFGSLLGSASILLIYLLGVFLVASRFGRGPSIVASLLSAPAFAFFYAPPIFSLVMTDLKNITGLGIMLIVANVTSNLVEKLRIQAEASAKREHWSSALYRFSVALSEAGTREEAARIAIKHIEEEFHSRSAVFLTEATGDPIKQVIHADNPTDDFLDSTLAESLVDLPPHSCAHVTSSVDARRIVLNAPSGVVGVLIMAPEFIMPLAKSEELNFFEVFTNLISQTLERIRLSEQAKTASLQAESEILRNSLLSAISHDLRTPLTRIVGSASALAEQDAQLTPEARKEFTSAIQDEAQHMADLMTKILNMARLTTGRLALHKEWNTLEEIIGSTLTRLEIPLQDRNISIEIPRDIPMLLIDAVLIQQVLINLLENAIKYTPQAVRITISAERIGAKIRLHIIDSGAGIPLEQQARLFEKFHRLAPESALSGVGLGLALCRSIMEAHGGSIYLSNPTQGGSDFVLELPLPEPPSIQDINERAMT